MTVVVLGHLQTREADLSRLRPAMARHSGIVRALDGCLAYMMGIDLGTPGRICVFERWRDAAAQSAHLIGDHMAAFNVAMQTATLSQAQLDAHDGTTVRRILEIPAKSFRPAYDSGESIATGTVVALRRRAIDALVPRLIARTAAARAAPGCLGHAVARDCTDDGVFVVTEHWRSAAERAAFMATTGDPALDTDIVVATARDDALSRGWRGWRGITGGAAAIASRIRERRAIG